MSRDRVPALALVDISDPGVAAEVLELQRRAYLVEAKLIGSNDIPPLRETLAELRRCGETFLVARAGDGVLAGAIPWRVDGSVVDLHRLVVDPEYFRQGVGSALVRGALGCVPEAERAVVQTGAANAPAIALYRREGFEPDGELEPVPGLRVARFVKLLGSCGQDRPDQRQPPARR
jgi:ribosomal protein S18 acetylase RimI-like enzyme